jgi:O-antigen/teichoic acid export membrane protein
VSDASGQSVSREVTRGTGLILAGATVSQAVEYVYRLALARGLGVEGFGTFSQARSVLLLLVVLASFGIGPGVKRFVALEREAGRGAMARRVIRDGTRLVVATAALGGVALWLLAGPLATIYRNPALAEPLRILAFALPLCVGLEYVTRVGEGVRSFRSTVVARQVIEPCLRVGATVVLVLAGLGLPAVMQAYVGSALVGLVVAIVLVGRLDPLRSLPRDAAPSSVGPLLRYTTPLVAGAVLFDVAERIDILMLGLYLDEGHVGIYAAGSALARSLLLLFASTMPVIATLAAEAVGRDRPEEIALLRRTTARWMLFFTVPIAAGFFLYAREAITVLFGREYAASATTARILIPAYLFSIVVGPLGLFLDALGKTHWTLANIAGRVLLNVGLNAVLIPRLGVVGAAIATSVAIVLAVTVHRINLGSLVGFRGTYAGWGRPLAVLAAACATSVGAARLMVATGAGGANVDVVAALVGGAVLVAAFWIGVKRVPGCLGEGDLALLGFFRERLGR